jgi:hypothetical protein
MWDLLTGLICGGQVLFGPIFAYYARKSDR